MDRVLLVASSRSFGAVNREQFYVSISRGRERVFVFTDDAELLSRRIASGGERKAAVELQALRDDLQFLGFGRKTEEKISPPSRFRTVRPMRTTRVTRLAPVQRLVQIVEEVARWIGERFGIEAKQEVTQVKQAEAPKQIGGGPASSHRCRACSAIQRAPPPSGHFHQTPFRHRPLPWHGCLVTLNPPKIIMSDFKDNSCLLMAQKHCACIEFLSSDLNRHGFAIGQFLHYHIGANDEEGKNALPEKLQLAFATADVTLTGWRLGRISDHLCEGNLLAVRSLPARYGNLDPTDLFVAKISVEPIRKE